MDWSKSLKELREIAMRKGFDINELLESTEIWIPNSPKDKTGHVVGAHGRTHMTLVEFVEFCNK
jgi:hypothetical protein